MQKASRDADQDTAQNASLIVKVRSQDGPHEIWARDLEQRALVAAAPPSVTAQVLSKGAVTVSGYPKTSFDPPEHSQREAQGDNERGVSRFWLAQSCSAGVRFQQVHPNPLPVPSGSLSRAGPG